MSKCHASWSRRGISTRLLQWKSWDCSKTRSSSHFSICIYSSHRGTTGGWTSGRSILFPGNESLSLWTSLCVVSMYKSSKSTRSTRWSTDSTECRCSASFAPGTRNNSPRWANCYFQYSSCGSGQCLVRSEQDLASPARVASEWSGTRHRFACGRLARISTLECLREGSAARLSPWQDHQNNPP